MGILKFLFFLFLIFLGFQAFLLTRIIWRAFKVVWVRQLFFEILKNKGTRGQGPLPRWQARNFEQGFKKQNTNSQQDPNIINICPRCGEVQDRCGHV